MSKYLGIINIVLFLISLKYLSANTSDFSIKKYPICHLMIYPETKIKFKSLLFLFSLFQLFFAYIVCQYLGLNNLFIFFFIGSFFLCLSSLLSVSKHSFLHDLTAIISVATLSIGIIFLSINIYTFNHFLGSLMFISVILLPFVLWLKKHLSGGLWEILLFLIIFSWNLIATFLIK